MSEGISMAQAGRVEEFYHQLGYSQDGLPGSFEYSVLGSRVECLSVFTSPVRSYHGVHVVVEQHAQ